MGKREDADLARRMHSNLIERTTTLRDELKAAENLAARLGQVRPGSAEYKELSCQWVLAQTTYENHKAVLDLEQAALAEEEEQLYPGSHTRDAEADLPAQSSSQHEPGVGNDAPPAAASQDGDAAHKQHAVSKGGAPPLEANEWLFRERMREPQPRYSQLLPEYLRRREEEGRPLEGVPDLLAAMRAAVNYRRNKKLPSGRRNDR